MGNICTSPKNKLSEERPIRNTEQQTHIISSRYNQIDKWNVEDVYSWLSTIDNGQLCELADKFREARIRGRILENVTKEQLIEMNVALGDRMCFKKARSELFAKCNYMAQKILMEQNSNPISHQSHANIAGSSNHSHHSHHSNHSSHHSDSNSFNKAGEGIILHTPVLAPQSVVQVPPTCMPHNHIRHRKIKSAPFGIPHAHAHGHGHGHGHAPRTHRIHPTHVPVSVPFGLLAPNMNASPPTTQLTIEENIYAAVDSSLIEGIDNYTNGNWNCLKTINNNKYKPPLNRSLSADEYKKNGTLPLKSHRFNKSVSNPIIINKVSALSQSSQSSQSSQLVNYNILKIAKLLKHCMKNQVKTGEEIVAILAENDNDNDKDGDNKDKDKDIDYKYQRIGQLLLASKLLIKVRNNNNNNKNNKNNKTDDTKTRKELLLSGKYEFGHSVYESMLNIHANHKNHKNHKNHNHHNHNHKHKHTAKLQSKNVKNININIPSIHTNSERPYCGGTQVRVYSPKSMKWRRGLILDFDENTKKGRICCYNSMGKQSIKELSLPSSLVKEEQHHPPQYQRHIQLQALPPPQPPPQPPQPQHLPMTVDSWNNYVRDRP